MKLSRFSRAGSAVVVGALALTLAACGSNDPLADGNGDTNTNDTETTEAGGDAGSSLAGTLNGVGASSQENAMNAWRAGFQGLHPDVTVNYDPQGSGAGRTQFLEGAVPFAGSDRALNAEEIASSIEICGPDGAINLPLYVAPIAVTFNLPGIDSVNLDADTIAAIFTGDVDNWSDDAIASQNDGVDLPDLAITPVHRADDSGTTENFTEYLAAAAPDVWTWEPDGAFPSDISGGESAQQTSGVIQAVQGTEGAVTYADASRAGALGTVAVQVGDDYVSFSPEAAAAVLDASERVEGAGEHDLAFELDRTTTESGAYPIVQVAYSIVCLAYEDAEQGELVKEFFTYVASPEAQDEAAGAAGSAPISDTLRTDVLAAIDAISVG